MFSKISFGSAKKLLAVLLTFAIVLPLIGVATPVQAAPPDGVYSFGAGASGDLGLGSETRNVYLPTIIPGMENVKKVEAGYSHSLILSHNGDVYTFGENSRGQLGHGDRENKFIPAKIEGIGRAKAVAGGDDHSLILMENGDVYSFGGNTWGMLGHGDKEDRLIPTKIAGISNAVAVSAGQTHSLVLLDNGDVYSFGYSRRGQLGQGKGGEAHHYTPFFIPGLGKATSISAGRFSSMVLLDNGDVYTFGSNQWGQLGYETSVYTHETPTKVEGLGPAKAVSAGEDHSLVLLENGDLYSFGQGSYGQLGHGDISQVVNRPTKVAALSGVSLIYAGMGHSLAVLENGDVYSFGLGSVGRLGHGDTTNKATPTRIEALHGNNGLAIAAGHNHSLVLIGTPPISISIDGMLLQTDVPPIILEGRTMVPLRAIFEALDVEVEWIAETRTIIGVKGERRIQLAVDSTQATVDGEEVALDVPATILEGRTLVPVRFIAESTGQEVDWNPLTRTVLIETVQAR